MTGVKLCYFRGGLFGLGLFNSRQKYLFLPFSESDFIFSIIGEELGLIGCAIVMFAFVLIIARAIRIAQNSTDRFGCYLASGIACIIAIQVLVNIAVVTGSIPPTGLPLPFVSAGSSSLIVFCSGIVWWGWGCGGEAWYLRALKWNSPPVWISEI